jgi:hypothetical protein
MTPSTPSIQQFTGLWQSEKYFERYWLNDLFKPYIARHVIDGNHQVVEDNVILFDAFVYSNDPQYYAKFRGRNAFLVHVGDEFYELGTDRYVHFRGIFRTMWSGVFNPKQVMVLPLGYSLQNKEPFVKASERRYAWSFIGEAGKSSRPDMVRGLASIEPHICFSSTPVPGVSFFDRTPAGKKRIPRQDFAQILAQSAFAPAPMGNASLESCRIYDALEAGAIPIVERRLTLNYFQHLFGKHPLPTVSSWSEARTLIAKVLADPSRLDSLQQECLEWWKQYQSTLTDKIGEFLAERSGTQDALVPLRSSLPKLPIWKYAELARHQDLSSFSRRVKMQIGRITREKKWRVAHRSGEDSAPK